MKIYIKTNHIAMKKISYMRKFNRIFNYFIVFIICVWLACSCSTPKQTIQYVPEVKTEYVEILRDTTILIQLPVEKIVNVTLDTTSYVETSLAKSNVVIKNSELLMHSIENKDITLPSKIIYKDIVRTDTITVVKTVYQDKVVERTKYPTTYWIFMGFTLLCILYLGLKIYLKLKI